MNLDILVSYTKRHITKDQFKLLVDAGMPLTGPTGLRRYISSLDIEAFARLYFPDEFTLEPPPIHRKLFGLMHGVMGRARSHSAGLKLALAIPRGHAKTTLLARVLPLHGLLFGWSPLTVLLGNTQQASERLLINIRQELETNPAIIEDFGLVRGDPWTQNHITSASGCAIRSFGVGNGAVRGVSQPGQRPSLVIVDDADDDQSVRSAVQLEANVDWFDKAIMGLGDTVTFTTSTIVVGTIIRKTSLLSHVLESPDFTSIVEQGVKKFSEHQELWDEWRTLFLEESKSGRKPADPESDTFYQEHKEQMLQGTEVLWPRAHAFYNMMLFRLARGQAAFDSEIQNAPGAASQQLGAVPFVKLPTDLSEWQRLGALDPTIKGGKSNDKSAWCEALFHRVRKEIIVSFCSAEQRPAQKTISYVIARLKDSTKDKRFDGLWCESNSSGALIADAIDERAKDLFYSMTQVHHSQAKEDRISLLAEYADRGQLYVAEGIDSEFVQEWESFGSYRYDDAVDAAATILLQLKNANLLDLFASG